MGYKLICYKSLHNLELSAQASCIGSEFSTFTKRISIGDKIFFYCKGDIWGSSVVSQGPLYDPQSAIWPDKHYPYRFGVSKFSLFKNPRRLLGSESHAMILEKFGKSWGYKILFTHGELGQEIGQSIDAMPLSESEGGNKIVGSFSSHI